jgi:hypothetical protein
VLRQPVQPRLMYAIAKVAIIARKKCTRYKNKVKIQCIAMNAIHDKNFFHVSRLVSYSFDA